MLVLTRKVDQSVQIGDNITVRVVKVTRGRVRLVIDAPRTVRVRRQEVPPEVHEKRGQQQEEQRNVPPAGPHWTHPQGEGQQSEQTVSRPEEGGRT